MQDTDSTALATGLWDALSQAVGTVAAESPQALLLYVGNKVSCLRQQLSSCDALPRSTMYAEQATKYFASLKNVVSVYAAAPGGCFSKAGIICTATTARQHEIC